MNVVDQDSLPSDLAGNRVVSFQTAARWAGVSLATFRREVAQGRGPRIVRLSARRVGVRTADAIAWLESKAEQR